MSLDKNTEIKIEPMSDRTININVPVLARVEGEGALDIRIEDRRITDLKLRIFEPPRLFEKFLEGRHYSEVPDIVTRICGICPVAYQMSAVYAFETLFGTQITPWIDAMRRAYYCGEWIESHALHIHLLALPDFLGYSSAPEMAKQFPHEVRRGLKLQGLGNELIKLFGARSVNPVGVKVGGFHRAPDEAAVATLVERLRSALPDAKALLEWVATLNFPDRSQDFVSVTLQHPVEYPVNMLDTTLLTSAGHNLEISSFEEYFKESQVPHSTALHSHLDGSPYLVGPLARLNLNYEQLHHEVKASLSNTKIRFPSDNPYHNIVARAAEIYFGLLEAVRLLEDYASPATAAVEVTPKAGSAYGCTEAPRGTLWHRYEVNGDGIITLAKLVPPTSQNQARIEEDLRLSLEALGLDNDEATLRQHAEQVIRNYDPCISCATHFIDLTVTRD